MTKAKPPAAMADLFDDDEPTTPVEAPAAPTAERAPWLDDDGRQRPGACIDIVTPPPQAMRPTLAVREVCGFPAALLPELGPTTLCFAFQAHDGSADAFIVTSSREAYEAAREAKVPVFVMREFVALAHAAQNDRMTQNTFGDVLARKRSAPEWILSPEVAFGAMPLANAEPLSCTVGDAFDKMGARLVNVGIHG